MSKLINGLRIIIDKVSCGDGKYTGSYEIHTINFFSRKLRLELSAGEPFEYAFRDAERLAVVIDAEFILKEGIKETILRKSQTGKYYQEKQDEKENI